MLSIVSYYPIQNTSYDFSSVKGWWASLKSKLETVVPKEQNRIFLFIDLNNSTSMAEKMGHIAYSMFISSFFNDFRTCLKNTKGLIYQYVGDEVIVSWSHSEQSIKESIALVQQFQRVLDKHAARYQDKFDYRPEFKAALHCGTVAVAKIGRQKLYHGDTLNTCARMLEIASQSKTQLLVSDAIAQFMPDNGEYVCYAMKEPPMRGKNNPVKIFSVDVN